MNYNSFMQPMDYGSEPYIANIEHLGIENKNFRTTLWTGCHLQMTLMCIPPCGEIGLEIHPATDQFIRVEQGKAMVKMGYQKECLDFQHPLCRGDAVFIPAGTWHNVYNMERQPLKLSVIYAPPNHPHGTVHYSKEDAERDEY